VARSDPCVSLAHLNPPLEIVGGGLAGLSLAAGLRLHGVSVTVHEAGHYPRHRVCGEFISGVEHSTLERLGIAAAFENVRLHRSVEWFHRDRSIHRNTLPAAAYGISRFALDQRLVRIVESLGGRVIQGSRGQPGDAEGRIWAAGRVPGPSSWIGLKVHFHDLPMSSDLEMHLGDRGYAGVSGVEDGRVNVCGLFRLDRQRTGTHSELLLDYLRGSGLNVLAERLERAAADESSFCGVSSFRLGWQARKNRVSIGDAAALIPPFTGNGMSMAFQSAECALDPLLAWHEGALQWDEAIAAIRDNLSDRFRHRVSAAMVMQGILERPIGRSLMAGLGRTGLLPFRPLLALVR